MTKYFLIGLFVGITYFFSKFKIVNQGQEALVERLGLYKRKLGPGPHVLWPLESIVWEDTSRERVLDIKPDKAITRDNVSLQYDAVVFWRVLELERTYYEIENVEQAIVNLVITTLSSEIGRQNLGDIVASRGELNQTLLRQLDEATESWGVKVLRVEVQRLTPSDTVIESMEKEQAADIQRRALVLEAEGTAEALRRISESLRSAPNSKEVLHFYITKRYVETSSKLSESPNSKVIFMDPKALSEALEGVIGHDEPRDITGNGSGNGTP